MPTRKTSLNLFFAVLAFINCGCAFAHPLQKNLWINTYNVDIANPQVVNSLLNQPVNRITLTTFWAGETLYATKSELIHQMSRYKGGADVLANMLKCAHRKHIQVYAAINCFHWTVPGETETEDVLRTHPELAELDLEGGCGTLPEGKFASPFNKTVQSTIHEIVHEVVAHYPTLDGIVFECRLPDTITLGYSETARASYIENAQVDPIDIGTGSDEHGYQLWYSWFGWRLNEMKTFVIGVTQTIRQQNTHIRIAARCNADWQELAYTDKNRSLEDWPDWLKAGYITELTIEPTVKLQTGQISYPTNESYRNINCAPEKISVFLPLRSEETLIDPLMSIEALQGVPAANITIDVEQLSDLKIAEEFMTKTLPFIEPVLQQNMQVEK